MKKVLLTILGVIVAVGVLAGAGFAGYRIGYNQGVTGSGNVPAFGRYHVNPEQMPMQRFENDFGPRNQQYRSPMMMERGNFGNRMFSPFRLLWNVGILALIVWFVYWLFTKSGWRITRQANKQQEVSEVKTEG